MTLNEAMERAGAVWGSDRVISVRQRPDGGVDVALHPGHTRASDTRGRNYSAHRLDANGHPCCHDDCEQLG